VSDSTPGQRLLGKDELDSAADRAPGGFFSHRDYRTREHRVSQQVGPGTFLIANPTLRDPNFVRTVVLLCEHGEQGSMGLVINRPSEVKLVDALAEVSPLPPPEEILFLGGPVQREALLVLHRVATPIPGAQTVCGGIKLGGDMQTLLDLLAGTRGPEDRVRVYAGYAGWGEGQLEEELSIGSWVTCPAEPQFVFDAESSPLWANVLRSLGEEYAYLVNMPLDPRVN
jgi:putative transcriptional regulator